jgi:hypothetical protein
MSLPRIRLRTLMIAVAVVALILGVITPALQYWFAPLRWRVTIRRDGDVRIFQFDPRLKANTSLMRGLRAEQLAHPGTIEIEKIVAPTSDWPK